MAKIGDGDMRKVVACFFLALLAGALPCEGGQYEVSSVFPTGVHDQIVSISPQERELAAAVQRALVYLGELPGPLICERPVDPRGTEIVRPQWTRIDTTENFETLKLTLQLRLQQNNRDWAFTPEFEKGLRDGIANGSLNLSTTDVPILPNGKVAKLLRVQYSLCDPNFEWTIGDVAFFFVDGGDMTKLQIVKGLGRPTDVFMYRGQAYFDSHSYRDFGNSFQTKLPKPQSQIYIHSMYDQAHHIRRACLLYWDDELTESLRKPGKKHREKKGG